MPVTGMRWRLPCGVTEKSCDLSKRKKRSQSVESDDENKKPFEVNDEKRSQSQRTGAKAF